MEKHQALKIVETLSKTIEELGEGENDSPRILFAKTKTLAAIVDLLKEISSELNLDKSPLRDGSISSGINPRILKLKN